MSRFKHPSARKLEAMKPYQHFWGMTAILSALLVGNMFVSRSTAQQSAPAPDVLTAREFRLVDSNNRVRATMSLDKNEDPQIEMFNPKGKKQIELKLEQTEFFNKPIFAFFDEQSGQTRFRLTQELWRDTVEPQIEFFQNERKVANFGININGTVDLFLSHGGYSGEKIILRPDALFLEAPGYSKKTALFAYKEGSPGLAFAGDDGKYIWTAPGVTRR